MRSCCIDAEKGEIAKTVLMPGDPLRAKFIAEKYLTDVKQFNHTRGMLGFTGEYKGNLVSVMGHGMGIPSIGLYTYELYDYYDVENIIRIGTCGAVVPELNLYDVILATSAYSPSAYAKELMGYKGHILKGTKDLIKQLEKNANNLGIPVTKGRVESGDLFFKESTPEEWEHRKKKKILSLEMEYFGVCANAIKLNKKAACLLTVTDSLITHEEISAEEREKALDNMIKIALEVVI